MLLEELRREKDRIRRERERLRLQQQAQAQQELRAVQSPSLAIERKSLAMADSQNAKNPEAEAGAGSGGAVSVNKRGAGAVASLSASASGPAAPGKCSVFWLVTSFVDGNPRFRKSGFRIDIPARSIYFTHHENGFCLHCMDTGQGTSARRGRKVIYYLIPSPSGGELGKGFSVC